MDKEGADVVQYPNPYFDWPEYIEEKMKDDPLIKSDLISRGFTLDEIKAPFDVCHVLFAAVATDVTSEPDLLAMDCSEGEREALWDKAMSAIREQRPFVFAELRFAMTVARQGGWLDDAALALLAEREGRLDGPSGS